MCQSANATSDAPGSDRPACRVPGATRVGPAGSSGGASESPARVPPGSLASSTGCPAVTPVWPRAVSPGAPAARSCLTPGYLVCLGGGDHPWIPLRVLDRAPRRCPLCRCRNRQYKGVDQWTRDRELRLLCGPCQRRLRVEYGYSDHPAPHCHSCGRRPRALKDYRRGRPSWRSLCWPCDRARRASEGLPAYRGRRGVRRWLRSQVRHQTLLHRQRLESPPCTRLLCRFESPLEPLVRGAHAPRLRTVCPLPAQGDCPAPGTRRSGATTGQTLTCGTACAVRA